MYIGRCAQVRDKDKKKKTEAVFRKMNGCAL